MFQSAKKSFPSKIMTTTLYSEAYQKHSQLKHYKVELYKPNKLMSDGQNVHLEIILALNPETDIFDWLDEYNQDLDKDDQWELHCALSNDELLSEPLEF